MKVLLHDNHDSSDSADESSPRWDGRGRLINNGIQPRDAVHASIDAQFGAPWLAGKPSPPALPVHRALKEAHLEVLPEAVIPFSLSGWPGLWARQNLHSLLLPVEQWIRNGVDSGRSTSGARNMLVHETACSGGPEMQV